MQTYGANKLKTALEMRQRIENWPAAWGLRLRRKQRRLELLRFRNGLNIVCRGGTRDWDVVHELMFAGGYEHALNYIRQMKGPQTVLDLGGNIGLFSMLAASASPHVTVHSYEPGPPNYRLFEMNRLANPGLAERIVLHREAVGGEARQTRWYFDENNPGGSGLFATEGASFDVTITRFADVLKTLGPVALAKIDIEGAEFEILASTPPEAWRSVQAVSLELHPDPSGKVSQESFLERMQALGFRAREERVCTFFLERT